MHYRIPALAGLLVLGSSAFALAQSPAPSMAPAMATAMDKVTVHLFPQNKSGETALATLTQVGPDVLVVVKTMGGPADPQPIHIHMGTCANLNPKPTYPLVTVQDATSTTTVKGITLASLENGDFAINIHHSTSDIPTYYACGDIPKMKM
jgi:hypothetical protein